MTEPHQVPATHVGFAARHPAIHFLWAAPIAVAVGLFLFFNASLNVCGISGCGGGGYGVSRGDPALTAMYLAIGSVVWTLPVGLIPWTKSRAARVATMLVLALAIGGLVWAGIAE